MPYVPVHMPRHTAPSLSLFFLKNLVKLKIIMKDSSISSITSNFILLPMFRIRLLKSLSVHLIADNLPHLDIKSPYLAPFSSFKNVNIHLKEHENGDVSVKSFLACSANPHRFSRCLEELIKSK